MKTRWILVTWYLLFAALIASPPGARAQAEDRFYYWVTPFPAATVGANPESFVIEVSASRKAEIEAIRSSGGTAGFSGRVASGPSSYNQNYYAAGQPIWNWHIASIDAVGDLNGLSLPPCPPACQPRYYANPSDIAADPARWIQENGDEYTPARYAIQREVDPARKDAVANVSNRGITGAGEKTLITGLIIAGGEPRNVVLRALGPSLSAAGVQQVAANPKLEVYRGSTRVASNADWRSDARSSALARDYPALAPTNDLEAAVLLTLSPGAYTLQGINEAGTEGVVLLEAYDVDAGNP
ncbi:MAG: hypothetical protein ABIR71_07260 [Chthoniobacterales bacterium]